MKNFYRIDGSGVRTETKISWTAVPGGRSITYGYGDWDGWVPANDLSFEIGGNTWNCRGRLTKASLEEMRKLWVAVAPKASLANSHVLGRLNTQPEVDTIVDRTFVEVISQLDDKLFSFDKIEQVWDHNRNCPPWEGDFFIATLLPLIPSYDLDRTQIAPNTNVADRYEGSYVSYGSKRCLKLSAANKHHIWRDAFTREVFCSFEAKIILTKVGIPEWDYSLVETSNN